ncbi:MAG TPA: GGDEF domain-containing protein [Pseudohongiella sp.]|nr:GGDEF domain-containing protein [Pseudohongiella sp.]
MLSCLNNRNVFLRTASRGTYMSRLAATPDSSQLLAIIRAQHDITRYGLDLNSVMSLVLETTQRLTGANAGAIELVEGRQMIYRAVSGAASHMLGLVLDMDASLSGTCVKSRQVLHCDDSETDQRVDRAACRSVGLRSMIVAPLLRDHQALGVVKVMSPTPHAFSDRDIAVLQLMSDLIAAAMYNADQQGQDKLYKKASTDFLTGIPNRSRFMEHGGNAIALAKRESHKLAMLMLDVDGLKAVNDSFGHFYGDVAIQEIASRIQSMVRQSDLAARIGGDEFAVMLSGVHDWKSVEVFISRLTRVCDRPLEVAGNMLDIGVSIGAALYPKDGDSMDQLMAVADGRMYEAKRQRRLVGAPPQLDG